MERNEIIKLYDIYHNLLTEKQRTYFEDYYFSDLSLAEIAENYDVSRNAVHDQLKRCVNELEDYENKLHLKEKFENISNLNLDEKQKNDILDILWEE